MLNIAWCNTTGKVLLLTILIAGTSLSHVLSPNTQVCPRLQLGPSCSKGD